jgi:hypothetical protein
MNLGHYTWTAASPGYDIMYMISRFVAKQKGHIGTFQRHFDSLSQKKSLGCCLSQQSLLILGFWMLHDRPASRIEKILALRPLCGIQWEQLVFGIQKMEVETPFSCISQSTSDEK